MENYKGLAVPPIVAVPVLVLAAFMLGFTIGPRELPLLDGHPGGQMAMTITN